MNAVVNRPESEARGETPAPPALIEVQEVTRTFGGVHAVERVSMSLPTGELTGLIGPNGAGKSTVLKMIAGAERPDAGEVLLEGAPVTGCKPHQMAHKGVIRTFQLSAEFPKLTVMENLLVAAQHQPGTSLVGALTRKRRWKAAEAEQVERARELLDRFGMAAHEESYGSALSGGQKRLVEIMRALMAEPVVLLLDEPFLGVDPGIAGRVEAHLAALRDGGLTMLMVEHELGVVERLSDNVVVMAQGQILMEGTMEEVRADEAVIDAYLIG